MKPCSEEMRQRMVACRKAGHSAQEVAGLFGVCKRSVERYFKLEQSGGRVAAGKIGGYRRSRLEGHERTLQEWIAAQNDLTLAELRERCREVLGVSIGINALWHRLEHLNLSYKKNAARRRARSPGRGPSSRAVAGRGPAMGSRASGIP